MPELLPVDHDPFGYAAGLAPFLNPPTPAPITRNRPYVKPGASNFNTELPLLDEMAFRSWVKQNNVPFNPNVGISDYDMRGFYRALQAGDPRAASAVNPNDNRLHYPDIWKTPYHETFSEGSQWAGPVAPKWTADDKLISPGGRVLFDERARQRLTPVDHDPFMVPVDHDPFAQ